jgi:hypothetical protein
MFYAGMAKATSTLLAALLLLAAVAPPAIRHTHPLADEGHSHHHHDANPDLSHGHYHHGEDRGRHLADRYVRDAELTNGHWWHLHFHFLGLEVTLPEPASDQGDRESSGLEAVSVLPFAQEPVPCRMAQTVSAWETFTPFTALSPEDAALLQVVVNAPPPVSCPPLCDRARRERSGVLIA